jgi:drug/metabolite transporter (DMT)-like permease
MKIVETRWTGDALVLLAAVIWGVAFYFQKTAMDHIGPLLFLGLRATIAALVLAGLAAREQGDKASVIPIALLGGAVFFIAASIQQIGIVEATVTNTGFLTALYVVVTPFIAWLAQRKAPPSTIWLGASLAFAGTWLLSGGSFAGFSRGDWLITLSSVFWSGFIVITGASGKHGAPMTYTCVQFVVVAVLALSSALIIEPISGEAVVAAILPLAFVGVLASAFVYALLATAMRQVPAPRAAILLSTETVFAALAGAIMLGERLPLISWSGAALLLAAVLVVQLGKTRAVR